MGPDLQIARINKLTEREDELFRRAPVAIVIFDDAMLVTEVNPPACQLLHRSTETLIGTSVSQLFGEEQVSACALRIHSKSQAPICLPFNQTQIALRPCMDIQPNTHALFVEDTSERHHLRCELEHRTRLETIGSMTSGVAHDFNNMLTAILSYAELQMHAPHADSVHRYAHCIQAAAERASETARKLLLFSRGQLHTAYMELDVNAAVREAAEFVGRMIGENIRIVLDLDPNLPPVFADSGELNQVLVNLAINARDAMPAGGELLLGTSKRLRNPAGDGNLKLSRRQGYVSVFVHDTGMGIRPEVLPHIFDPFYTTKAQGHGTGLGLSTVYKIVRECNGQILVKSEPVHGTTFEVLLPACRPASPELNDKSSAYVTTAEFQPQILD